jgi:hypothetical protein
MIYFFQIHSFEPFLHPWTKTCDFKYVGWSTRLEQNAPDLYGEALYKQNLKLPLSGANSRKLHRCHRHCACQMAMIPVVLVMRKVYARWSMQHLWTHANGMSWGTSKPHKLHWGGEPPDHLLFPLTNTFNGPIREWYTYILTAGNLLREKAQIAWHAILTTLAQLHTKHFQIGVVDDHSWGWELWEG